MSTLSDLGLSSKYLRRRVDNGCLVCLLLLEVGLVVDVGMLLLILASAGIDGDESPSLSEDLLPFVILKMTGLFSALFLFVLVFVLLFCCFIVYG